MDRAVIIICGGAGIVSRAAALALVSNVGNVVICETDHVAVRVPRRIGPPRIPVEAFFEQECEAYRPESRSEAGQLRRDNLWREQQSRALFNARVNQDRRRRKQARGIGRR